MFIPEVLKLVEVSSCVVIFFPLKTTFVLVLLVHVSVLTYFSIQFDVFKTLF